MPIPAESRPTPLPEAPATTAPARPVVEAWVPLKVPPVLLAGDFPPPELWSASLPGIPEAPSSPTPSVETGVAFPPSVALWIRPRDPFCIVVFWQVNRPALDAFAAAEGRGTLRLRLTGGLRPDQILLDEELPFSTDHRFVPVPDAGCRYVAEIGFDAHGAWRELARSSPMTTPVAGPTSGWTPLAPLVTPVIPTANPVRNVEALPAASRASVPSASPVDPGAEALLSLVWEPATVPAPLSSAETTQWVARVVTAPRPAESPGLPGSAELVQALPPLPSSADHPAAQSSAPGFWFEVNAEIVLYGRTERDARVTIGGRPVTLRPDGSFSFRFSLPDGAYELPVVATCARGDDERTAQLQFARATEYGGEVGRHPQDPALKPPGVESVTSA